MLNSKNYNDICPSNIKITYFSINDQEKLKMLTKIFTYIISKNIEVLKFNYIDNVLVYDNCQTDNKLYELHINKDYFNEINIYNKNIIQIPLINIIKDLKSYKGKKIFPNIYFLFTEENLIIRSIYTNDIELTNVINNQYLSTINSFSLKSDIDNKTPDLSFTLSIDKINILLNNSFIKEFSEFVISNNSVSIIFIDTHSNKKIIKSVINNTYTDEDFKFLLNNNIIKDLMKFFKDNIIKFDLFKDELKIIYNIQFQSNDILLKLISNFEILK